jgi:hypothetical protein
MPHLCQIWFVSYCKALIDIKEYASPQSISYLLPRRSFYSGRGRNTNLFLSEICKMVIWWHHFPTVYPIRIAFTDHVSSFIACPVESYNFIMWTELGNDWWQWSMKFVASSANWSLCPLVKTGQFYQKRLHCNPLHCNSMLDLKSLMKLVNLRRMLFQILNVMLFQALNPSSYCHAGFDSFTGCFWAQLE